MLKLKTGDDFNALLGVQHSNATACNCHDAFLSCNAAMVVVILSVCLSVRPSVRNSRCRYCKVVAIMQLIILLAFFTALPANALNQF